MAASRRWWRWSATAPMPDRSACTKASASRWWACCATWASSSGSGSTPCSCNVHCAEAAPARGWLALLCASRLLQAMIVTAYSGVLPFMMADWHMTAAQAGSIQSAWHIGYMSSLFAVGLLADRFGPHRVFLIGSVISAVAAAAFAVFAHDHRSA